MRASHKRHQDRTGPQQGYSLAPGSCFLCREAHINKVLQLSGAKALPLDLPGPGPWPPNSDILCLSVFPPVLVSVHLHFKHLNLTL